MGWWSIRDEPKKLPDGRELLLVAGDQPADELQSCLNQVLLAAQFIKENSNEDWEDEVAGKITQAELDDLFLHFVYPPSFPANLQQAILETVHKGWEAVRQEYRDEWEREPFDEEIRCCYNFVIGDSL